MILSNDVVDFLQNKLIKTASLLGVENVILEKDKIRAIDDKKTTIILHDHNLSIPFDAVGLTRLSLLSSRLSLAGDIKGVTVDAVPDERSPGIITRLDIKAKRFKVDFRTANPAAIKAPKGFKSESGWQARIAITDNDRDLLLRAANSMPQRTETGSVCIVCDPTNETSLILTDTNSDSFEMAVEGSVESTNGQKLVVNYPLKQFLTLVKHGDKTIEVGEKNLLKTTINDVTVLLLPIL